MFENFNLEATQAMYFARQAAQVEPDALVSSTHILRGILMERNNIACQCLTKLGVNLSELNQSIGNKASGAVSKQKPVEEEKLSLTAIHVIKVADETSLSMGEASIGTEHLLMGILKIWDGVACRALNDLGITHERINATINALRMGPEPPASRADEIQALREELAHIQSHICTTTQSLLGLFEDANRVMRDFVEKH